MTVRRARRVPFGICHILHHNLFHTFASHSVISSNYIYIEQPHYKDPKTMKPQMEEVEDDLAAEEENKLINEVR